MTSEAKGLIEAVGKKVLRPYQGRLADLCLADIYAGKPEILLAACPGAGKTEIALSILSRYLKPGMTALVLAHGTVVLKTQFEKRLAKDYPELVGRVRIAIPHERRSIKGHYDLLVVDEAHEFYEVEKGMVDEIKKKTTPKSTLLLTGSPSVFIGRAKNPLVPHAYSLEDMNRDGVGKWNADLMIELATSKYNIKEEDYARSGEVSESVKYTQKQTDATLDSIVQCLVNRLRVEPKKLSWMESLEAELAGAIPTGQQLFTAMNKTIIACPRQVVADQVGKALSKMNISCIISHSENDPENLNIDRFKAGEANVLVVVGRGLLGFDMDTLINFIDMTGSKNPNRIFQMECRVVRTPQDGSAPLRKLFLKVMPDIYSDVKMRFYMSGVLMLAQTEFFSTWNGKNFMHLETPAVGPRQRHGAKEPSDKDSASDNRPEPVLQAGMMVFGDYFKGLAHTHDESLESHAWCRLADVFRIRVCVSGETYISMLKNYFNSHGQFPGISDDPLLRHRLDALCNKHSSSYRPEFNKWARANGYGRRSVAKVKEVKPSIARKARILEDAENGIDVRTSSYTEYQYVRSYGNKANSSYDADFAVKLEKIQPRKPRGKTPRNFNNKQLTATKKAKKTNENRDPNPSTPAGRMLPS